MKVYGWVAISIGVAGMAYAAVSVIAAKPLFGNPASAKKPIGVSQYETNVLSRAVSLRRDPFHASHVTSVGPTAESPVPSNAPPVVPPNSVNFQAGPPVQPTPVPGELNPAPATDIQPLPQPATDPTPAPAGGLQDPAQPGALGAPSSNPVQQAPLSKKLIVKAIVSADQVSVYFEYEGKILPPAGENAEPVKGLRIHHLSSQSFLLTAGGKTTRYHVGEEVPLP